MRDAAVSLTCLLGCLRTTSTARHDTTQHNSRMVIHLKLMKLAARYRSSGLLFHFFDKHHHAATQSWFLRLPADWDGRRDARTPNFYVHKTPNRAIVVDRIIVCSKSEKIFIMIFACSLPSDLYSLFSHCVDFSGESPAHKAQLALIRFHADRLLFSSLLASPVEQLY